MHDESKSCIWLRYSTSYTREGQDHSIEMNIPVPIGATPEVREQLFREAEAGMEQLVKHMGQRRQPQTQRANTPSLHTPAPTPASTPPRPASVPAPLTGPQPSTLRESEPTTQVSNGLTPRSQVSASMPRAIAPSKDMTTGNLQLPQFIQYIKENMNLTPREAMELLNVRSLTTGINLREALEQLKVIVHSKDGGPMPPPTSPAPSIQETKLPPTPVGFDEEVGPDEPEAVVPADDVPTSATSELSPQQLEKAHAKITELRESQGATTVSASRLQVLNNVVLSQISNEELLELIEGIWNISILKKLKVDQAEALISWAKLDDYFSEVVYAVLAVLEEERYARGNR